MAIFLLGWGGAVGLNSCATPRGPVNDPVYQSAEASYLSQDYTTAVRTYTQFIESHPLSPYASDACYWRGMACLQLNDYERAAADFQKALEDPRDRMIHAQALYHLGQGAGLCGDFRTSERAYRKLLQQFPTAFPADEITYSLALACMRQGRWDEADAYFRRIVKQYPQSSCRGLAEEKLASKDHFFSVQVGAFGSRAASEASQRQLKAAGFPSFIRVVVRQGVTYHCMRTGSFKTWEAARECRNRVAAAGFREAAVVP
jgi:TolA-binding protein